MQFRTQCYAEIQKLVLNRQLVINLCWCDTPSSQIYPSFAGLEAVVFSTLQFAPPELVSVPLCDTAERHMHILVFVYYGS